MFRCRVALLLMSPIVALVLFVFTGTLVPRNADFRPTPDGVPLYVVSNGFHTELVLPLREARTGTNWLTRFGNAGWAQRFGQYEYVGFGWGDEQFYRESYGGRLPGAGTVLRALFPDPSLMHVDFYATAPRPGRRVVAVRIAPEQYQRLVAYIEASFQPDSAGRWPLRQEAGYTPEDFFFPATGRYHALRTCNDWTNQGLRRSGIRSALKAPLAASVLYQLRRVPTAK